MTKQHAPVGTESTSNGYAVIKQEDGTWKYKHHLIMEKTLGRSLKPDERVAFKDRDKSNLDPDNLEVKWKAPVKEYKRLAFLRRKVSEARARLDELEKQLSAHEATMEDGPIAEPQEGRGGRSYQSTRPDAP